MRGVTGVDLAGQIAFLEDLCPSALIGQWQTLDVHGVASKENMQGGGYGVIEAEILHAFVRRHRPGRVVQVGCGLSTSVILRAASIAGYKPDVICIEPYPSEFLLAAQAKGQVTLVEEIIPKSLKIQLYKAVLESNASEHGARMTAMDKATENAGDLLRDLQIMYNRTRQAAITKEILEIVAGAEALG